MPKMRSNIRILQKAKSSNTESILVHLPAGELGWKAGEAVRVDKQDEDTVIVKRVH